MKKIRSSQPAIPVLNGVKHQFFPGSIVNNQNVRNFYAWPDSTVVLHWLNNKREYKVFVGNPVVKIKKIVTLSGIMSQLETVQQI